MASATSISKPAQMIITLEDNALIADIKKALKLIRGIASVRVATLIRLLRPPCAVLSIRPAASMLMVRPFHVALLKRCNAISTVYDIHNRVF